MHEPHTNEIARQALDVDSRSAEPDAPEGYIAPSFDRGWAERERVFEQAMTALSSSMGYLLLSTILFLWSFSAFNQFYSIVLFRV